jgi:hypothetical protein
MSDPHDPERRSDSPLVQMMVSMSGASAPEHETEPPGANPVSFRAGHEPDKFQVKGILYVPLFVTTVIVLSFILISAIFFGLVQQPSTRPVNSPQAAELNNAPINERFARISSTEPAPLKGLPDSGVPQPRLEYLKQTRDDGPFGDPPHLRSKVPPSAGNSPEYRPEDLRPENYVDPVTGQKVLAEVGWVDAQKRVARIPIQDAIKMVVSQKKLPVKKDEKGQPIQGPAVTSVDRARLSNAGFGGAQTSRSVNPERKGD